MGKVGSSTLFSAINELGRPTIQLHSLSDRVDEHIKFHRKTFGITPVHLYKSIEVKKHVLAKKPKLLIITLVRDPIQRYISDVLFNKGYSDNELSSLIDDADVDSIS